MALSEFVFLAAALYFSWSFLRPFIVKSPLDNLPGPPSPSFIGGKFPSLRKFSHPNSVSPGNLQQYIARQCWDFREEIQRKYGRVVLLHGLFGVRLALR